MARRFSRGAKRAKDLVWITTVFEGAMLEGTQDLANLVIPADWSFGNAGFDRATLMGIRGWMCWAQTAAATATEATTIYMAVYVTDQGIATGQMDPSTATEYVQFDTIYTDGYALSQNTGTGGAQLSRQIDIRSKRKLTTAQDVRLAATMNADSATPRCTISGCFRCLLKLNPS